MRAPTPSRDRGFTLLEVLVAMAILAIAVTTVLRLASQSLRLLRLSGEHQDAVLLADRLMQQAEARTHEIEQGEEGPFVWERRIAPVPVPEELTAPLPSPPPSPLPPQPELTSIAVTVRWGRGRTVELATLRAGLVDRDRAGAEP